MNAAQQLRQQGIHAEKLAIAKNILHKLHLDRQVEFVKQPGSVRGNCLNYKQKLVSKTTFVSQGS